MHQVVNAKHINNADDNKTSGFFKPAIQPNLMVNTPGSEYEREAGMIADGVMRMTDAPAEKRFFSPNVQHSFTEIWSPHINLNNGSQKKIQRADDKKPLMDDVTFETETGVGAALVGDTTLKPDPSMGKTYTASCNNTYSVSFKFVNAYKGTYPSSVGVVKGVYVQIEVSYKNVASPGLCQKLRLIQVLRYFTKGDKGEIKTASPTNSVRNERAAFNTDKPSPGWMVDRDDAATDPYYTASGWANEGSENTPATLWDAPAYFDSRNHGKEFYTCAVCEGANGKRWIPACIRWGYYIDNTRNVSFSPQTPEASCNYPPEVKDASERWDTIPGNTPTGITF